MLKISDVEPATALNGLFTNGSVAGGISPTRLVAAFFNAVQTELVNIVETSGMQLDKDDPTQVLKALHLLFLQRAEPFADIKSDGAVAVSKALANLGLTNAIIGDDAHQAGFELGRITSPYLKQFSSNTIVRLATKDYADVAAATVKDDVVASAPSNMNTLKKISAALGDDAGFLQTMRDALALKQTLDATLTSLSGKGEAGIRNFLGLKTAALRDVGAGPNQIPDMGGFTSSLSSPGWQKLPSGLIIQWGTANPTSTGEVTITFPVAFSAYPMYMGFGPQQVSLPNVVQSPVISGPTMSNTGCGVRNLMINTAGGVPVASMSSFFWIAIGK